MQCHEMRPNPHKEYIKVRADHQLDGRIIPIKFRAEEGPTYIIDRIIDIRQAPSLKAGGQGTRYTCEVEGQIIYIFHDRSLWFREID